jgi:O-antigen/teichoic acid export membrane protein
MILTVPVSAMIFALAPSIPALLGWSNEFHQAVPLMMLLVLQQPVIALNMVLGTGLIALSKERPLARLVAVAAVLSPALNLVLIPLFQRAFHNGAIGAALAQLCIESVMLVGMLVLLPRHSLDKPTSWRLLSIALAGGCLVGVVMVLTPLSLPLAVAFGGGAFLVTGIALRVLKLSDLRHLRQMVRPGSALPQPE